MNLRRKGLYIIGWILLLQILLVGNHEGEFWPFSIYPMFSQAGDPWTRTVVRQVDAHDSLKWDPVGSAGKLPGSVFPLDRIQVSQNDLADFVAKNKTWDRQRIEGLRSLFSTIPSNGGWLIYKVNGQLKTPRDTVIVTYTPYIYLNKDTTKLSPFGGGRSIPKTFGMDKGEDCPGPCKREKFGVAAFCLQGPPACPLCWQLRQVREGPFTLWELAGSSPLPPPKGELFTTSQ